MGSTNPFLVCVTLCFETVDWSSSLLSLSSSVSKDVVWACSWGSVPKLLLTIRSQHG